MEEKKNLQILIDLIDKNDDIAIKEILINKGKNISGLVYYTCIRKAFMKSKTRIFQLISISYICRIIDMSNYDVLDFGKYLTCNHDMLPKLVENWLNNWFRKFAKKVFTSRKSFKNNDSVNWELTANFDTKIDWDEIFLGDSLNNDISDQPLKNHRAYVRVLLSFLACSLQDENYLILDVLSTCRKLLFVRYSYFLILTSKYYNKINYFNKFSSNKKEHPIPENRYEENPHNHYIEIMMLVDNAQKLDMSSQCEEYSLTVWKFLQQNYQFNNSIAFSSIVNNERTLSLLLDNFAETYSQLFLQSDYLMNRFPFLQTMKTIFNHKNFSSSQKSKDFFFRLLFSPSNFNMLLLDFSRAFRYIIYYSESTNGLSKDVINLAYYQLINNSKFLHEKSRAEVLTAISLNSLSILTWYGYSFSDLKLTDIILTALKENPVFFHLINILLIISSPKNYGELTFSIQGHRQVKPMKEIAIWKIRENICRPFQDNLNRLIKLYNLPAGIEKSINLKGFFQSIEFTEA